MLENVFPRDQLTGYARLQGRAHDRKSVKPSEIEEHLVDGWTVRRKGKVSLGLERAKRKSALLESRVWTLLHQMRFTHMSGKGGALLRISSDGAPLSSQVDVCAIDGEASICCECKSFEAPRRDTGFQEKLAKFGLVKKPFGVAVGKYAPQKTKRHHAMVMFTWDILLTENDRLRAKEQAITLFDQEDLAYFEALTRLLGPAARFQFLAEVFRHKAISGLEIRVPALRMTAGASEYFTFAVRPDYLLKVSYVAHRAKGKAIDVDAYQRMISKSRLKQIGEYISSDGTFPNNIVINFEQGKFVRFERGKQEGDDVGAQFGWLTLTPAYGAAWIIDGQHRLYAYSGHPRASTSSLSVLAFSGLSPSKQAQLFVDINSEQRRVKRSLLVELDAILKWESDEPDKRVDAIVSKTGLALDVNPDSPLCGRIQPADVKRTDLRCVTLNAVTSALNKTGFFIVAAKKGAIEYGPLWRDEPDKCLRRTLRVVTAWLSEIASIASDWWELGAAEGGGLAMNNGVTVMINVLRSVLEHLNQTGSLLMIDDADLVDRAKPYARSLGQYFARIGMEERKTFRELQGVNGQTTGTRMCQEAMRADFPKFCPPGLDEWVQARLANTNAEARELIEEIERTLQDFVLGRLKEEYTDADDAWWYEGVPLGIRQRIGQRIEESKGSAGTREQNFDLIHYREIAVQNWSLFQSSIGFGTKGNKSVKTEWLVEVSQIRNAVSHVSRREYISLERLQRLRSFRDLLLAQIDAACAPEEAIDAGESIAVEEDG